MEKIQQQVGKFISENFLVGAGQRTIDPDDSFLEKSIVDSTGILEIVAFVESTFSFKIKDEELIPDNLDSVNKVSAFIQRKLNGRDGGS